MILQSLIGLFEACVLVITGASSMEDVPEQQVEHLEWYVQHPLAINEAPLRRLSASGLMSDYQAFSLADYRARCGDVSSVAELAAVDGFGAEYARALQPFVSFSSQRRLGQRGSDSLLLHNDLSIKAQIRTKEVKGATEVQSAWGAKYRATLSGRYDGSVSVAARTSYGDALWPPASPTFSLALGNWVVGDFNIRAGQGLALWSGMMLSGYCTLSSYMRSGTGVSPSFSYTSDYRGVAGSVQLGRCQLSGGLAFPGLVDLMGGKKNASVYLQPVVNASWLWQRAQLGVSATSVGLNSVVSAIDGKISAGKFDFFGECAAKYDASAAAMVHAEAIAGCYFNAAYRYRYGVVGRLLPKDRGVAAGVEKGMFSFIADALYNPSTSAPTYKALLRWGSDASRSWRCDLRFQERLRPRDGVRLRSELRADATWEPGPWRCTARLDALYCKALGGLGYIEAAYSASSIQVQLRGTAWNTSGWNDRIYCYERDVPGSFSVPARYGKGWLLSAYAVYKPAPAGRHGIALHIRLSTAPEARVALLMGF